MSSWRSMGSETACCEAGRLVVVVGLAVGVAVLVERVETDVG